MGSSTENSAYGPTHNPWDLTRVPGGSGGGSAAAVSGRSRAVGARLGHRRLDQAAGGALRQRRPAADLRDGLALRRRRVRVVARPGRPGGEERARLRLPLLDHRRARRERLDDGRRARRWSVPQDAGDLKGVRVGVPKELNEADGIEPGVRDAVRKAIELAESLGAEVGECSLPRSVEYGLACYYLVAPAEASSNLARYDGVRYGLREQGDDFREMVMNTRDDGLRRRAEAADHARHLRALVRLLRRVLREGAAGAHGDQARARRGVRAASTCSSRRRARRSRSSSARRPTNPLAMYLNDLLTIPSCMAGLPGLSIPCGLSDGPAGRPAADRAAVRREHALPGRACARARARLRRRPGAAAHERDDLGAGDRPRDPRAAEDAHEDVLPLPRTAPAASRTRRPARSASRSPARCRCRTGARSRSASSSGSRSSCQIAERAVFHRKNYFYPDLPKAYQISQYDEPLCSDGKLAVPTADGDVTIGIVRAHLEEDAAKNVHVAASGPHPRRDRDARRLQPRRHAARRDRDRRPTSTTPRRRSASCSCCGRPSSSSGSPTPSSRRARCASTSTSRCARRAATSCARARS